MATLPPNPPNPTCTLCNLVRAALALAWKRRHGLWACAAALLWPVSSPPALPEPMTAPAMVLTPPANAGKLTVKIPDFAASAASAVAQAQGKVAAVVDKAASAAEALAGALRAAEEAASAARRAADVAVQALRASPSQRAASAAADAAGAAQAAAQAASSAQRAAAEAAAAAELRWPPAKAVAVAAAAPAPAWAASSSLHFIPVPLRPTPVGKPWGPVQLLKGGKPPYTVVFTTPQPDWMRVQPDGRLSGEPPEPAQVWRFRLRGSDATGAPAQAEQAFELSVYPPKGEKPSRITLADTQRVIDTEPAEPRTYKLAPARLEEMLKAVKAQAQAEAQAQGDGVADGAEETAPPKPALAAASAPPLQPPPPLPGPSAEVLEKLLKPLLDLEFPTAELLRNALREQQCEYYKAHLKALNLSARDRFDLQCPPPESAQRLPAAKGAQAGKAAKAATAATAANAEIAPAAKPASKPGAAFKTLAAFHDELLPADWQNWVLDATTWRHPLNEAKPLLWAGAPRCGCMAVASTDEVYGLFAYWHATQAQQAVQFNQFSRISYLGALLKDDGSYTLSSTYSPEGPAFVRKAQRHNTKIDLTLYRRDWSWLATARPDRIKSLARTAAENAVKLADTPLQDFDKKLQAWLLPFWKESSLAYDGLTVFFDFTDADERQAANFKLFLDSFMAELTREMQQRPTRAYRLNLVVPDHQIGEDGPYSFRSLIAFVENAEPPRKGKNVAQEHKILDYKGHTDITVEYLVLLGEPTTKRKKVLREKLDATSTVQGHRRIALLDSMIPILLHPRGDKPAALTPDDDKQFDDDLAYMKWNYGGVASFPTPVKDMGTGETVLTRLRENFRESGVLGSSVCDQVCPWRVEWRLGLQALVLANVLMLAALMLSCEVRRWGRPFKLATWGGILVSAGVFVALLNCDPALKALKASNSVLWLALGTLLVLGWLRANKAKKTLP